MQVNKISSNGQTIDGLNDQITQLQSQLDEEKKKNDDVSTQISSYESLLNAYVVYTTGDALPQVRL